MVPHILLTSVKLRLTAVHSDVCFSIKKNGTLGCPFFFSTKPVEFVCVFLSCFSFQQPPVFSGPRFVTSHRDLVLLSRWPFPRISHRNSQEFGGSALLD